MLKSVLLLLVVATVATAAPPAVVVVPKADGTNWTEVRAERGRLLTLAAEPASKWLLVDEDGADLRVFDAGKHAAFAAPADGRFKLIVTGPDGTAARVIVVVGEAPSPPPPDPKPKPDVLRDKLKKAFDEAPDADKKDVAKDLAELYKKAAVLVATPEIKTAKELLIRARDAANILLSSTQLVEVRKIVSTELLSLFPADAELTAASRKAATDLFLKLADILDQLGG